MVDKVTIEDVIGFSVNAVLFLVVGITLCFCVSVKVGFSVTVEDDGGFVVLVFCENPDAETVKILETASVVILEVL